jgi:hypothetical protein
MLRLPPWSDAPRALLTADGHCGALAAWVVLRHFGVGTSSASLLRSCRYSRQWGVFTIGIAVALAEHGIDVVFHTDPDPDIQPLERTLYARARRLAIPVEPPIHVPRLADESARGNVPVVFYRTASHQGHFSPVAGIAHGRVVLPNDARGDLLIRRFRRAWRSPGFPRQVVIASSTVKNGQRDSRARTDGGLP